MSDNSISSGQLSFLSTAEKFKTEPKSNELGQDAFLQLMITQMNNQNPLEPQSNSEFVAQLAQFSSVEGLEKLNGNVEYMMGAFQSSHALQASSLVGRKVTVSTEYASLSDGGDISGKINVPSSAEGVTLNVYDSSGTLVSTKELGAMEAGKQDFLWDGTNESGEAMKGGSYTIEVLGKYGDDTFQLETEMHANVDSVTVGANGTLTLNVDGVGPVLLSNVREIT